MHFNTRKRRLSDRQAALQKASDGLKLLKDLSAASPIPIGPVFALVNSIVSAALVALSNEEDCVILAERSLSLIYALVNETAGQKIDLTAQIQHDLKLLSGTLNNVLQFVEHQQKRSFARRLWTAKSDGSAIIDLHGQIDRALEVFNLKSHIAVQRKLEIIKLAIDDHHSRVEGSNASREVAAVHKVPPLPPAPSIFFGRQDVVDELVKIVLSESEDGRSARVAVLGAGGVGKTSLTLVLLHNGQVEAMFGTKRFFARCDAVTSADGLLSVIAVTMGVSGGDLLSLIRQRLLEDTTSPSLLVLDNFETPWEPASLRESIEEVLNHLASISSLSIVITLRGLERPLGPKWTHPFLPPLKPLDPISARLTFLAISDSDEAGVIDLLQKLDYLPLAITLMANLAQFENTSSLLKRWETEHVSMLARGSANRLSSMEVSIQVSVDSPRVQENPEALPLLRLISLLPDGVEDDNHLEAIAASFRNPSRAAATLKQVSLAYSSDTRCLAVLAPVREFVTHRQDKPALEHRQSLVRYYLQLAAKASTLETGTDGEAIIRLLTGEVGNLQAVLTSALSDAELCSDVELFKKIINAALETTDLYRYTGLGDIGPLEKAANAAHDAGFATLEALCIVKQGELLYARSKREAAAAAFQRALDQYKTLEDQSGQSRCYLMLGMIENQAGSYSQAAEHVQLALDLARKAGDSLAEADCLLRLAQSSAWTEEYSIARDQVKAALETYIRESHSRAQARCQWLLGFIDFQSQADYDSSLEQLTSALAIYRAVGDPTGEANCLRILGRLCLARYEFSEANAYLHDAVKLYQSVKWTYGLADSHQALGEVAVVLYEDDIALAEFKEALVHYEEVKHRGGKIFCHRALGDIAFRRQDLNEARSHILEAGDLSVHDADKARHQCDLARLLLASPTGPSQEELDQAFDHCSAARDAFEKIPLEDGRRLRLIGSIQLQRSQVDDAKRFFREAANRCLSVRGFKDAGESFQQLGRLELEADNKVVAKELLDSANEQFRLAHDTRKIEEVVELLKKCET